MRVTRQDMEGHVTGETEVRYAISIPGQSRDTRTQKSVYFDQTGSDLPIQTDESGEYTIPLNTDRYGFPDTRTVEIDNRGRVTGISSDRETSYRNLFRGGHVPLNEALETLGAVVNDSMRYDIDGLLGGQYEREGTTVRFSQALKRRIQDSGYSPTGKEPVIGICHDAGYLVRTLLDYTLRDPSLRYIELRPRNETGDEHDVTLVFDIETGHWTVVNSKSPLKPYNLVSQEKLEELGHPLVQ